MSERLHERERETETETERALTGQTVAANVQSLVAETIHLRAAQAGLTWARHAVRRQRLVVVVYDGVGARRRGRALGAGAGGWSTEGGVECQPDGWSTEVLRARSDR